MVYDLEHTPFDVPRLTGYLQWLLDRRAIAEAGLTATKTVFVRMPVNAREMNEWVTKNVLDTGVHGLVFPHTETAEQALHAVSAMRYPQAPGAADAEPAASAARARPLPPATGASRRASTCSGPTSGGSTRRAA